MAGSPMTIVDMHAHYYGGLVDSLARRTSRPYVASDDAGRLVLHAMTASTVMLPGYTDIAVRLADLDRAGIGMQLLTFPGALGIDVMPRAEVEGPIRDFNDHLADVCRASGGRLVGLAGLPLADIGSAAAELKRSRARLGLAGAILPGNFFLTLADAERLRPLLAAADEVGALLMVHPGLMPGETPPQPYGDTSVYRTSALNLQASLSHMVLTLIAGGFPARYRNVTFQVVNLGGTLPFVLERLDAIAASRGMAQVVTVEALRGLVYDCASLGPRALALAVEVIGADRIMAGTDYPIFPVAQVRTAIDGAKITARDRELVCSGTARAVLSRYPAWRAHACRE